MFTRGLKAALACCIKVSCIRQVLSKNLLEHYAADQMQTEASYATDFILPALKGCSMYLQNTHHVYNKPYLLTACPITTTAKKAPQEMTPSTW